MKSFSKTTMAVMIAILSIALVAETGIVFHILLASSTPNAETLLNYTTILIVVTAVAELGMLLLWGIFTFSLRAELRHEAALAAQPDAQPYSPAPRAVSTRQPEASVIQ